MPKFCVATINFFDNDLKQEVITAETWLDALYVAASGEFTPDMFDDIAVGADMEQYKQRAFDSDSMFSVIEISDGV
jgi:hypothetical protein